LKINKKRKIKSEDEFQKQVLERLEKLDKLDRNVEQLSKDSEKFNDRFTNYQQATQSLVSLAFGLIASATVITVVSAVLTAH
jgi:DNA repair exonuclease SbcCD ATPase subunit